ncbi:ATP-binding protein [Granulicella sp. dw_53]|uniref:ATP-binding protein n=1 Tax=Granulicella sp. dw_53 TaxID=2719792 RepID=UPI002104218D|nr:ATP-binding protein [Granulicella sp. dw_53]
MSPELLAQLREVDILSSLSEEELSCMHDIAQVDLPAGEHVARQGEMQHHFWLLLSGELRVYKTVPDGRDITFATLSNGATFGELPLLSNSPNPGSYVTTKPSRLMKFTEDEFWELMTSCPQVRKAILGNMAIRLQKLQSGLIQQEKMASLGTLAAGLMHELNNPGAAATRAASQLRENLMRLHELTAKFSKTSMSVQQKECLFELQEQVLTVKRPLMMNSLEQSDAEDALVEWMEESQIENAWKLAPTLVAVGIDSKELECARSEFPGPVFSDALSWLEAMVSSMQLVGTIEDSIGRVSDLVKAVKAYAYEGKNQRQDLDVNGSIHATLVMLGHKLREKQVVLEKELASDLPPLRTDCSGLNQIWTNLLDNAIDAVPQEGHIHVKTWREQVDSASNGLHTDLCISIRDDGSGIPLEIQPHIFDPFYTTKPVGVGTGLGLGIVHRIVEQFGGAIHFSSDDHGTEFVVRLPAEAGSRA